MSTPNDDPEHREVPAPLNVYPATQVKVRVMPSSTGSVSGTRIPFVGAGILGHWAVK